MLAKIFSNKTLCLTTPEVDLAFDYDSLGAEAYAVSLGINPKQFEGDVFTLIGLLGGEQAESDARELMGEGLEDVMAFLHFENGKVCFGDVVGFSYDNIRLILESDKTEDFSKRNFCIEVVGGLSFSYPGAEQPLNFSGILRINMGNMGFAPVNFSPDESSTQLPSEISIPLLGCDDDLLLRPDIKSMAVLTEGGALSIQFDGTLAISGGPEAIQHSIQEQDGTPLILPLELIYKKGLLRLASSLFIPVLDINLQQVLNINSDLGSLGLDVGNLTVNIPTDGMTPMSSLVELHCRLPQQLNNLMPGLNFINVYDPASPDKSTFKIRLGFALLNGKPSLQSELISSPFKDYQSGDVSISTELRQDRLWWKLKLAEFGHVEIMSPIFSSDSVSGAMYGSGAFKIIEPISLPLSGVKDILSDHGLGALAPLLPGDIVLPMQVNGEPTTLGIESFGLLGELAHKVLNTVGLDLTAFLKLLPDRMQHFLTVGLPSEFAYNFNLAANGSCTGSIKLPEGQALKLLLPAGPTLYGIELRELSLGQYNGGQLGVLEVDGSIDLFMLPEIVASMAASAAHVPMLPTSNRLITQLKMDKLLALVDFKKAAIQPVFFDELKLSRIGVEGFELLSQWQLPKPVPDVLAMAQLISPLIDFVTVKDYLLDASAGLSPFNTHFEIGENYIQLPQYLGATVLGKKGSAIAKIEAQDLWPFIAHALNFVKTGRVDELLACVPIEHRCNSVELNFFDLAGLNMDWLISSNKELPQVFKNQATNLAPAALAAMHDFLPSLPITSDEQLIVIMHGGFELPGFKVANTFGVTQSDSSLSIGFALDSELAYLMQLNMQGAIGFAIEPEPSLSVYGGCELALLDQPLMRGEVSLINDVFTINGALGLNMEAIGLAIGGQVSGAFSPKGVSLEGSSVVRLAGINLQQGSVSISDKGFMATASLGKQGGTPAFSLQHCALAIVSGRRVKTPKLKQLSSFPLLKSYSDQTKLLKDLSPYLPQDKKQFSLAGGVKFNSYHLINSKAMLMMSLGAKPSAHLVGSATMQLPANTSKPVIKMVMDYQAHFDPTDGVIKVQGGLADNSYVLSKKAKLTGRFAYYAWLSGKHEGDFVVSMGGYHPKFKRPSHYPALPRLSLNWKLTSKISVKGSLYAALTPVAVMAGGKLEAQYKKGNLKAWFNTNANFLMYWQPFYYEADMGVRIGASYKINLGFLGSKTVKASMGADLELWGPEFAGKVKVDWSIISFTIRFGDKKSLDTSSISWNEFEQSYLASAKSSGFEYLSLLAGETGTVKENGDTWHLVDPDQVELQINSPTPLHQLTMQRSDGSGEFESHGDNFHLAPVNGQSTKNWNMSVTYSGPSGMYFVAETSEQCYAAAVWGEKAKPSLNESKRTLSLLNSARVVPAPGKPPGFTEAVDADEFKYQDIIENDPYWQWGHVADHNWQQDDSTNRQAMLDTLDTQASQQRRQQVASLFSVDDPLDVSAIKADIHSAFIGTPSTLAA